MYYYKVKNFRVVDGDTIDADIDLGFNLTFHRKIRLKDVYAPELSEPMGLEAMNHLSYLLTEFCFDENKAEPWVQSHGWDKYGRVEGVLYAQGKALKKDLNELMRLWLKIRLPIVKKK